MLWHMPDYKGLIACGANRIGKSELGAYVTALIVTGEHPTYRAPTNGRAWIVGLDSKAIASICRPKFEAMIPQRYKDQGEWNGKLDRWILRSDGREWEVWFKSVDAGRAKFQGEQIDFAWIDEEPIKEGVWKELETRMVDRQAPFLLTATPVEGTKWLQDMIERKDVYATMAGMRENPFIPLDEIEKLARQLTKDERDVRIEGKYVIFGGRPVFDRDKLLVLEANAKLQNYQEGTLYAA